MTQNNEMPDVLFVDPEKIYVHGVNTRMYLGDELYGLGDVEYIRKGAPSPFIDPKVQPIPEGLADGCDILYKRTSASGGWMLELHTVARARDYATRGMLLGYIILPPE